MNDVLQEYADIINYASKIEQRAINFRDMERDMCINALVLEVKRLRETIAEELRASAVRQLMQEGAKKEVKDV